MKCSNHLDREAIGMCVRCHKLICEECAVKINNKYYCKNCVSAMYSNNFNNSGINTDKVKEYADKAVNVTKEATNEALNLVKDFSKSEEVQNTITKAKSNPRTVQYILAAVAILILLPGVFDNFERLPYIFEEILFELRYYNIFRTLFYIIGILATFIQPLVVIALASLCFNNFMRLNNKIRMVAPAIVVVGLTLVRLVSINIAVRYFNFHIILSIFSYIIPVALITVAAYLEKE